VQTFVGWGQSMDPLAARRSAGSAKVRAGPEEASLGEPRKREGSNEGVSVDESAKLRGGSNEEASVDDSAKLLAGSNEEASAGESANLVAGSNEEASVDESAKFRAGSNEEPPHAATAYR